MAFFTPWKLSSQKLGFFLVTFGFIWGMMLLHFTIQQRTQHESSSMLREQILDLSKRYIKALAEENRNVVDGPYVGTMTAYDLKKTLAVLLDNILLRIGKLESKVDNLVINGTGSNSTNGTTTAIPSMGAGEKLNVAAHTPDNSFLGFVVEQHINASDIRHMNDIKRQNQSLVYGKVDNFWKDKKTYLDIIHTYMEVHGTVHGKSTVHMPNYVKNHGILSGRDLQFLLRETKLFVGLGFPYEGPAPLEAIANGCAFLNPKFSPPKSSRNTDFFKGKPTLRELTSQHPYAEVYIGKPHVWTVNINDPDEVEKAVKAILNQKNEPYLPYEFTCEGMLQRVNAFIEKQDFCHGQVMWPPLGALQVKFAEPGKSCKQVCQENQLVCEPSYFQHLNKDKDLAKFGIQCQSTEMANDIVVPSINEKGKHCILQGDLLLFSCAGSHSNHKRICPCRDYMKGQVALCKDCL
ncbi:hypothetical protein FKM82_015473 [Ascaphus truei]